MKQTMTVELHVRPFFDGEELTADRLNGTRGEGQRRERGRVAACDAPPHSHRSVDTTSRPVLYDHHERPIYRRVGFAVKETKPCR